MTAIDSSDVDKLDTLPKWLHYNTEKYRNKVFMRHKDFGIWNTYTWLDCYQHCKHFVFSLYSLGLERGDKVAIVGDNDPYWYWAEYASQAVGGVALGLFVDSIPSEANYIVAQSDSRFIVAKDQEQVDKMLGFAYDLPIKKIIYWEYKGLQGYDDPLLIGWKEVEELGRKYEQAHPGFFEESINNGRGDDYAVFLYTSGTSGSPKGAMHTHKTLLGCSKSTMTLFPWTEKDKYISCFAPGYVGDQMFGVTSGLIVGAQVNFPEAPETVNENIREVGPQFILLSNRMWESTASMIMAKMLDSTRPKKLLYDLLLPVGYKVTDLELTGKGVSWFWRVLHFLGYWMVFRPLKDKLGLLNVRFSITAGGTLSPDCFRFFHAIGLPMRQAYGCSELMVTSGHLATEPIDSETVGRVAPRTELRITRENEILSRNDGLFIGYYKEPEKTAEARGDGWFHSGDAGTVNDYGQVIFWDRVADMLQLRSGARFPPQYVEGKLKFSPFILDGMVLGEGRDFVACIVAIDFEVCGRWAESHHVAYTSFTDLSQKPEIIELIRKDVQRVNRTLPLEQRVKRFANLHKQFDPDEAELTRTRKLRRGYMEERYKEMIDAIYSGQDEYALESSVTFRDGRTAAVKTNIKITSVE